MSETIELKETPLSDEDIQRDYVDIKGAAQIFGNVSEKTARRYLSANHSVSVHSFTKVVNGGVGKLYRKADVIAVASILKVIPSVVRYEAVTVGQSESLPHLPKEQVTERKGLTDQECLLVSKTVRECLRVLEPPGIPEKPYLRGNLGGGVILNILVILISIFLVVISILTFKKFEDLTLKLESMELVKNREFLYQDSEF